MKRLHWVTAGFTTCCFIPEIYDIIIPPEEKSVQKLQNIFIVMEFQDSDLKKVMRQGVLTGIS